MLGLVRIALSRPFTFIVLAVLILIAGLLASARTPTDIFPNIGIPVISVVWSYNGLPPDQMSGRVVYYYERQLTHLGQQYRAHRVTVAARHGHRQDLLPAWRGHPHGNSPGHFDLADGAQADAARHHAAADPQLQRFDRAVLQMALSSTSCPRRRSSIRRLKMRPMLTSVAGVAMPTPYGGAARQVTLDLDPRALARTVCRRRT